MNSFYLKTEDSDKIAEGVIFSNGRVAVSWLLGSSNGSFYNSIYELSKIHRDLEVVLEKEEDHEPLSHRSVFEIGRANNGWIVREYESGSVIVASENYDSEHEAFLSFLWSLISEFGPSDSKYSPQRIQALIVPGSDSQGSKFSEKMVLEKITDHLDYSLRFLHNVENKSDFFVKLQDDVEKIFDNLMARLYHDTTIVV